MSRMRIQLLLAVSLMAASPFNAQQAPNLPAIPGLPLAARDAAASIDPEKIRAHVRFLSLDLLEGRGPGTRGAELAAEYIATQFTVAGVEPAGDNGTYFQRVPLYAVHTVEDKTKFAFAPAKGQSVDLSYGTEIVAKDRVNKIGSCQHWPRTYLAEPCVFVSFGGLRSMSVRVWTGS